MRLGVGGRFRSEGSGVLCPWRDTDFRPTTLRRRAGRPQLKRDPLDGAASHRSHLHKDMSLGARHMAYVFLGVILAFSVLSTVYLWRNDFAKETLDVIFPAIGAIVLSLYLGFKIVRIDAPSSRHSRIPVAVLLDRTTGMLRSMAEPVATDPIEHLSEFAGLRELDTLPLYNAFAQLRLTDRLRVASDGDTSAADTVLLDLVEYAILQWLAMPANSIGYTDFGSIHLLQSGGGGGGQTVALQPATVQQPEDESNPLLKQRPVSIPLPRGARVVRTSPGRQRTIEVRTHRSHLIITLALRAGCVFDGATSPAAVTLRKRLRLPQRTPSLWTAAFMVDVETGQSAFTRFSKQAKVESEWLEHIHAQFAVDFSWDRLRSRLASSQ